MKKTYVCPNSDVTLLGACDVITYSDNITLWEDLWDRLPAGAKGGKKDEE